MKQCISCKHEANDAASTCVKCGEGSWRKLEQQAEAPVEVAEDVPIEPAKHLPERRRRRL